MFSSIEYPYSQYAAAIDTAKFGVKNNMESKELYIRTVLLCNRAFLNDLLHVNSVVTLNQAYRALGIDEVIHGDVVGWSLNNPNSDRFIDFYIQPSNLQNFIHGDSMELTVDFNVDGMFSSKDLTTYTFRPLKLKGE